MYKDIGSLENVSGTILTADNVQNDTISIADSVTKPRLQILLFSVHVLSGSIDVSFPSLFSTLAGLTRLFSDYSACVSSSPSPPATTSRRRADHLLNESRDPAQSLIRHRRCASLKRLVKVFFLNNLLMPSSPLTGSFQMRAACKHAVLMFEPEHPDDFPQGTGDRRLRRWSRLWGKSGKFVIYLLQMEVGTRRSTA